MIILGLGSNLGDRLGFLRSAVDAIKRLPVRDFRVSNVYRSQALTQVGASGADPGYLNCAVAFETDLAPSELLRAIKSIESQLGRKQNQPRWSSREIDIDILAWDDLIFENENMRIPHAELLNRPFALWPLMELAPNWIYPVQGEFFGKTMLELGSRWRAGSAPLDTTQAGSLHGPDLVGVVNVTPDSFSDGGLFHAPENALKQARALMQAGARVIDVGAESTRPGAAPVGTEEEWARLQPVIHDLSQSKNDGAILSIDTRHAATAARITNVLREPYWINDVTGFSDPRLVAVLADAPASLVVMHSLGIPPSTENILPLNCNPIDELLKWADSRIKTLGEQGIARNRIIIDPGIGFGKNAWQSISIIKDIARFHELGVRILVGHSRKSFLSLITSNSFANRDVETVALSLHLARQKVHYLRVHDVAMHTRALRAHYAIQ